MKKIISLLLVLALLFGFAGCGTKPAQNTPKQETKQEEQIVQPEQKQEQSSDPAAEKEPEQKTEQTPEKEEPAIDENGSYYSKDDVALYIHTYGHLPGNFISKNEAKKLGWEGGSVEKYAPGKAIGGDKFGNYEELLPKGHKYTECDIDTNGGKSRGAKRIIFSDDGLVYYTEDHYESFELLYGEE